MESDRIHPQEASILFQHIISDHKGKRLFCENCLNPSRTQEALADHERICGKNEPTNASVPEKGSKHHFIEFTQWRCLLPVPWVIYADFEAVQSGQGVQNHTVSSFCYKIHCIYPEHKIVPGYQDRPLGEARVFCGPSALKNFYTSLFSDAAVIEQIADINLPYDEENSEEDMAAFKAATECHICGKDLGPARHFDHDHYTGKYRGAAHPSCNMQYSSNKYLKIPVVFHNLRGYDGYFVVRGLLDFIDKISDLEVIAKNLDKFTCITVNNLRFIDSLQFLNGSLDTLVKNYVDAKTGSAGESILPDISILKVKFAPVLEWTDMYFERKIMPKLVSKKLSDETIRKYKDRMFLLSIRKGVYPYDYMDSMERMKEKSLPPQNSFYSGLYNTGIPDEEYAHAYIVWKVFDIADLREYTELYNVLDVLLLECLFEAFRSTCIKDSFGLDPAHFVTAPSLSWASMLKLNFDNSFKIENLTDYDMVIMVENGIRGGMCQVMNPYARANVLEKGRRFPDDTFLLNADESVWEMEGVESKILYFDANNLYGWAMSQPLPSGCYRWEKVGPGETLPTYVSKNHIPVGMTNTSTPVLSDNDPNLLTVEMWQWNDMTRLSEFILSLDPMGPWGYILEVDIECPSDLHEMLNDYPLFPEHKCVKPSPYTLSEIERLGLSRSQKIEKLVCDLEDKTKYVVHFRNLQQGLQLGYKLKKVHRVISFKQEPWLAEYINYNTQKRKGSKNSIEKDYWKLMNNSIFGKMMEQVRKRRSIKFFLDKDILKALRDASGPYVKHWRVIEKDKMMIMEMAKHTVLLNRPMIMGQCILDISKWLMFDFYYTKLLPTFGLQGMRVLYTDTDSLVIHVNDIRSIPENGEEGVDGMLIRMQRQYMCFDLSEFVNKGHPLLSEFAWNDERTTRVPGKFKDELGGRNIEEFIAIRSKMYSVKLFEQDGNAVTKSKMKGIPEKATVVDKEATKALRKTKSPFLVKEPVRRRLTHEDYLEAFHGAEKRNVQFRNITHTKSLEVETKTLEKVGLTACDDKSYYFDAARCLRYGNCEIGEEEAALNQVLEYFAENNDDTTKEDEFIAFIEAEIKKVTEG